MRAPSMIGVFGGTFDPIHYGHLRPAAEVMAAFGLAQVRFIPAGQPPHRPPPLASAEHRLRMVQAAVADYPGFTVDDRELRRPGPSYTVDTLESLRAELGEAPLCLIIGLDMFAHLDRWHRAPALTQLAHLIVMQRPGLDFETLCRTLPAWAQPRAGGAATLTAAPAGAVVFAPVTPQPISASALRADIAQGRSVDGRMPEAVARYIRENRLYAS